MDNGLCSHLITSNGQILRTPHPPPPPHPPPLKQKCRHFDEIFITGCTGSCHFDNFQYSQWWTFHQNEDSSVSVKLLPHTHTHTHHTPHPPPTPHPLQNPIYHSQPDKHRNTKTGNQTVSTTTIPLGTTMAGIKPPYHTTFIILKQRMHYNDMAPAVYVHIRSTLENKATKLRWLGARLQ